MRSFGIILMIISGIIDGFAMIKTNSISSLSQVNNYSTVLGISTVVFFVGLAMTIFGRNTKNSDSGTSVDSNTAPPDWTCSKCGMKNSGLNRVCSCGTKRAENVFSVQNKDRTPNGDEWKCSNCGRINKNYVGTCGCGQTKSGNGKVSIIRSNTNKEEIVDPIFVPPGKWKCNSCKRLNSDVVTKCIYCGEKK